MIRALARMFTSPAEPEIEARQAAERRAFHANYVREVRPDGSFIIRARYSGAVVGSGWIRPGGREDLVL